MQLAAEVLAETTATLANEVHRSEGRETEFDVRFAWKERRRDFDGSVDSRIELETKGAGRRRAVEQRIDRRLFGVWLGRLDPEFAKKGKFLGGGARLGRGRGSRAYLALVAGEHAR